jgi:hypothetical protein
MAHPDRDFRAAMRWYYSIGRRVWPYELWHWLFRDRRTCRGPKLADFWDGAWKVKTNEVARPPASAGTARLEPATRDYHLKISRKSGLEQTGDPPSPGLHQAPKVNPT